MRKMLFASIFVFFRITLLVGSNTLIMSPAQVGEFVFHFLGLDVPTLRPFLLDPLEHDIGCEVRGNEDEMEGGGGKGRLVYWGFGVNGREDVVDIVMSYQVKSSRIKSSPSVPLSRTWHDHDRLFHLLLVPVPLHGSQIGHDHIEPRPVRVVPTARGRVVPPGRYPSVSPS